MKKLQITSLLVAIAGSMLVYIPPARAAVLLKLPSGLGLAANLVGHWTIKI